MCVTKPLSRSVLHTSFTLTVYPREITTENETQERVVGTWTGVWVTDGAREDPGKERLAGGRLVEWMLTVSVFSGSQEEEQVRKTEER